LAGSTALVPARHCGTAPRWTDSAGWSRRRAVICQYRCRLVRIRRPWSPTGAAQWAISTLWQWGWQLGGSAQADPARAGQVQFGAGVRLHRRPVNLSLPVSPVHALHRHPATHRRRDGRVGRRLEHRRHTAGAATAHHRSDRLVTTPLGLQEIRKAPKALLHDHSTVGCVRQP